MTELERRLLALGRELDYPPEPDIAAAVHERLAADPWDRRRLADRQRQARSSRDRRESRRALRMIAIACLVLLALAATALAVSPAARDALRDLFDIGGVTIETTTAPAPEPARRSADLGERTTLGAARARLGFRPLVPAALGHPDATFADPAVPALALVYRPGPRLPATTTTGVGLLVTELPGRIAGEYLHKVGRPGDQGRSPARRWPAGGLDRRGARTSSSRTRDPALRARLDVAQNVLLIDRGRLLVRLEGALDRSEAVRIARSLAPR